MTLTRRQLPRRQLLLGAMGHTAAVNASAPRRATNVSIVPALTACTFQPTCPRNALSHIKHDAVKAYVFPSKLHRTPYLDGILWKAPLEARRVLRGETR